MFPGKGFSPEKGGAGKIFAGGKMIALALYGGTLLYILFLRDVCKDKGESMLRTDGKMSA